MKLAIFVPQSYQSGEFGFGEDVKKPDLEEIVEDKEAFLLESHRSVKSLSVTLSNFARQVT